MTVAEQDGVIRLLAPCPVEDAESLLGLLQASAASVVDLTDCGHLHTAIVQLLLTYRPMVTGAPGDPFVLAWIMPFLKHRDAGAIDLRPGNGVVGPGLPPPAPGGTTGRGVF
jgi:hypothetical protein